MKFPAKWLLPAAVTGVLLASGTAMAMAGETTPESPAPQPSASPSPGSSEAPAHGITGITWSPERPVPGDKVTFTAKVTNADGARWEWTLTGPGGKELGRGTDEGQWTVVLPADAPADLDVRLTLSRDGGSVSSVARVTVGERGTRPEPALTVRCTAKIKVGEFVSCRPDLLNGPSSEERPVQFDWSLTTPPGKVWRGPWFTNSGTLGFYGHYFADPGTYRFDVSGTVRGTALLESVTITVAPADKAGEKD